MDAAQWRRNVRVSVAEGALATAMGTLMSGAVLTGFALSLGAGGLTVGILAGLPALANLAQLLGARWLNAGVDRKRFCMLTSTIGRAIWLVVLAVPFVAAGHAQVALAGLVALVAISSVLSAFAGVAWLSWIRDLAPPEKRLGFLALRNQFDTALALTLSIGAAAFIDWWTAHRSSPIGGFVCVLVAATVCGLVGLVILNRMDDAPMSARRPSGALPTPPALPARDGNFRNLLLFYVCWNLANHMAAPFFVVYMLQKLSLPFWHVTALQALFSITALSANIFWTRLGRRIGTRSVVGIATACDAFYPLCWVFLAPDGVWLLPLVFLFGAFNAPLAVGAPVLVMGLAPDDRAPSYLAGFNATMGLVIAVAAVVGGSLASLGAGQPLPLGVTSLDGLQLVFLLSFVGRLASLLLLQRVREPGEVRIRAALASLVPRGRANSPHSTLDDARVPAPPGVPIFDTAA